MKIIGTQGQVIHWGDLAARGHVRIETAGCTLRWMGDDIQLAPSGTNRLQLTSLSGAGSVLEFKQLVQGIPGSFQQAAGLFSWTYNDVTELWAMNSEGTAQQLTSHAQDAPAWMYDADDPFPRILKELNVFIGQVRYTNASRMAQLLETFAGGGDPGGLPADQRRCVHVETFEEHNQRLGLTGKNQWTVLDWAEAQNQLQRQYEAARQAAIQRGETPPPDQDIRKPMPQWMDDRLKAQG
jgi:hypothetical protein